MLILEFIDFQITHLALFITTSRVPYGNPN